MTTDNFKLSNESYLQRQQIELNKMNSMIDYLNSANCRQITINTYFNSECVKCGECDNCRSEEHSDYSTKELLEIIPTLLPSNTEKISEKLNIDKHTAERAIHKLLLEEQIRLENDTFILND